MNFHCCLTGYFKFPLRNLQLRTFVTEQFKWDQSANIFPSKMWQRSLLTSYAESRTSSPRSSPDTHAAHLSHIFWVLWWLTVLHFTCVHNPPWGGGGGVMDQNDTLYWGFSRFYPQVPITDPTQLTDHLFLQRETFEKLSFPDDIDKPFC